MYEYFKLALVETIGYLDFFLIATKLALILSIFDFYPHHIKFNDVLIESDSMNRIMFLNRDNSI